MIKKKRNSKRNKKNTKKKIKNRNKTLRKYKKLSGGAYDNPLAVSNSYKLIATLGTTDSEENDNTHFNYPEGLAVLSTDTGDRIYVADTHNHRVQIFNGNTRAYIATLSGSLGTGNTQFNKPLGVAVSATGDRIYVSDPFNYRVQIFDGTTRERACIGTLGKSLKWESGSESESESETYSDVKSFTHFSSPIGVAVSATATGDRIYVVDQSNHRVQIFDGTINADGHYIVNDTAIGTLGTTGSAGASNTQFNLPRGVAVSGDIIYVADSGNHRVQIFDGTINADGHYIVNDTAIGTLGTTGTAGARAEEFDNQFDSPSGVAVSATGNRIYVLDSGNNRVQVFEPQPPPPPYYILPSYENSLNHPPYYTNNNKSKYPPPKYSGI